MPTKARSAVTGQYVPLAQAKKKPRETVIETEPKKNSKKKPNK